MNNITIFDGYRSIISKFESSYLYIINNIGTDQLLEKLSNQLKLINSIKDNVKKKYLYDKLNAFRTYLSNKNLETHSGIYFIYESDRIEIDEHKLSKEWLEILNNYDVNKYIFLHGTRFNIDYLINLLSDVTFTNVIQILPKQEFRHILINSTKRKIICTKKNNELIEYIQNISLSNKSDKIFLHGSTSTINNLLKSPIFSKCQIFQSLLSDEQIVIEIEKVKFIQLNSELQSVLDLIHNEKTLSRLVFGHDILEKSMNCELKKIYYTDDIDIQPFLEYNTDLTYVKSLSNNDSAYVLKKDYGGIIGLTYY